jgi:hypothetical protein
MIIFVSSCLNVRSPLLNLHLKASKQVKRGKNRPRKQYVNYQLSLDGIHPKPILAKAICKFLFLSVVTIIDIFGVSKAWLDHPISSDPHQIYFLVVSASSLSEFG